MQFNPRHVIRHRGSRGIFDFERGEEAANSLREILER
jgi:hypothetical protein